MHNLEVPRGFWDMSLKYWAKWQHRDGGWGYNRLMYEGDVHWQVINLNTPVEEWHDAPILCVTGSKEPELSGADLGKLRAFVYQGGTLVIDAAGGDEAFQESAESMLADVFGRRALRRLAGTAALFGIKGHEIRRAHYRRRTRQRLGNPTDANLRAVLLNGRPAVIYSREDITCGLVGYPAYTLDGYAPQTAYELMRNFLLAFGD